MKKRILFVDDESAILDLMKYMMRNIGKDWDTAFALSGQEALALMAKEPFDVVVTDVRMPGMDGVELLKKVKKEYPRTARFVFSGESEQDTILQLVSSTHQFLLKPYDLIQLRQTIERAFMLRDLLSMSSLENIVTQIKTLPSIPELYFKVVEELQSSDPSIETIGALIGKDIAMSAKLLQLVNSAFFGLRQHVSNPTQAASLIGLEVLKSLVLVVHIFTQQDGISVEGFSLKTLWNHSLSVGVMSQDIALAQGIEKKDTDGACIAGLFHDLGKLVLMANLPEPFAEALRLAQARRRPEHETEREVLGASHEEVGAYLLGLWGFDMPVIEACAFHHEPQKSREASFGPLTTVHVANVFDYEVQPSKEAGRRVKIDMDYLSKLGLADRLPVWRRACGAIQQTARDTYHGTKDAGFPG